MSTPLHPLLAKDDLLMAGGGFFLALAVAAVGSFFANSKYAEEGARQPIAFDHRLHVEDEGLECSACHAYYRSEAFSGLPGGSTCALCHLEPQGESAEEAELVRMLQEQEPLRWVPLFRQPPHVFFSHRRHVVAAELECETCHGSIGHSEAPPTRPRRLTMDACLACHEEHGITEDCASCHR